MGDSDDHEPGVAWTGRRVAMSPPIKHRTGISGACALTIAACNLLRLIATARTYGNWPLSVMFGVNALYFVFIVYVVRDHDRTWGASPLGTSRKGGRDS